MNKSKHFIKIRTVALILIPVFTMIISCEKGANTGQEVDPKEVIAQEIEEALRMHVIDPWYPRSIDSEYGGYKCDFDYRWQPSGTQRKMIVSQARHVWSCSKFASLYPGQGYDNYARHGFEFLKGPLWDQEYGGFFSITAQDGEVLEGAQWDSFKTAYGNAFGIYGLSALAMSTQDAEVLSWAKKSFRWLDKHAHDPDMGGYFQFISREGNYSKLGAGSTPAKDQNSTIHLLEAFTELYQVWPNDTLKSRLNELLVLVRDTITTEVGYMNLFFNHDWSPVVFKDSTAAVREANYHLDHVSFGHDVETAYLMMEASEVLGIHEDHKTFEIAKKMVDHALSTGWDQNGGGFYDRGYYLPGEQNVTIITDSKVWWSQVEALNTLLIMADLYPEDPLDYYSKFEQQWEYLKSNLFDSEYQGVFVEGLDNSPESKTSNKGGIWKVNYHTARSLMNCMHKLRDS